MCSHTSNIEKFRINLVSKLADLFNASEESREGPGDEVIGSVRNHEQLSTLHSSKELKAV